MAAVFPSGLAVVGVCTFPHCALYAENTWLNIWWTCRFLLLQCRPVNALGVRFRPVHPMPPGTRTKGCTGTAAKMGDEGVVYPLKQISRYGQAFTEVRVSTGDKPPKGNLYTHKRGNDV